MRRSARVAPASDASTPNATAAQTRSRTVSASARRHADAATVCALGRCGDGVTVAFPDADEFLRRFTVVHGNISDGMTKYSTAVGVVGKATSTIGDDYANTIDQTKVGADQVSQALGDIPQV